MYLMDLRILRCNTVPPAVFVLHTLRGAFVSKILGDPVSLSHIRTFLPLTMAVKSVLPASSALDRVFVLSTCPSTCRAGSETSARRQELTKSSLSFQGQR